MSEGAVAAIPRPRSSRATPSRGPLVAVQRVGRRPWGTYVLWVVTILGFAYLFIPLITIVVFTFNDPGSKFNTAWKAFTCDNWANAFQSTEYTDALIVSLKVAFVSCVIATILGTLIALALGRYRIHGGGAVEHAPRAPADDARDRVRRVAVHAVLQPGGVAGLLDDRHRPLRCSRSRSSR